MNFTVVILWRDVIIFGLGACFTGVVALALKVASMYSDADQKQQSARTDEVLGRLDAIEAALQEYGPLPEVSAGFKQVRTQS